MNQENYLQERLDDQIDWYDRKSIWNQRWYKRLQLLVFIAAATIPFLSGYIDEKLPWIQYVIGLLGMIIAATTAILGLYNFQENWIKYRTTCESLKKEKYRYLTNVTPYGGEDSFTLLVERVEGLISKENTDWAQQLQNAKEKKPV
jgi:hypothetical protein